MTSTRSAMCAAEIQVLAVQDELTVLALGLGERFPTSDPASGSDIAIASTRPLGDAAQDLLLLLLGPEPLVGAGDDQADAVARRSGPGLAVLQEDARPPFPPPEPPYSSSIETPSQPRSASFS